MRDAIGTGLAIRRRHSILVDAIARARPGLGYGQAAYFAIPALRPPDMAAPIECNQVGCAGIPCLRQVLIDISSIQCARRWRHKAANLSDRAIIFREPDCTRAVVWSNNAVGPAVGRRCRGLNKLVRRGDEFADAAGSKFCEPEVARRIEGEIVGCGVRCRQRPLLPTRHAVGHRQFAERIRRGLGKPDIAVCIHGQEERAGIACWFCIILHKRKALAAILRDAADLRAARRCGVAARLGHPDVVRFVEGQAPWQ